MFIRHRERRLFLAAVFFTFGTMCGVITAECASADAAAASGEWLLSLYEASAFGACILGAAAMPALLLLISMTLFGAFLVLPCVMLSGSVLGWLLCCMSRCGILEGTGKLLCLAVLIPQIPCLLRIAASAMRISESLRTLAAGSGLRRPDVSADLRTVALCFSVELLSALLLALFLQNRLPC